MPRDGRATPSRARAGAAARSTGALRGTRNTGSAPIARVSVPDASCAPDPSGAVSGSASTASGQKSDAVVGPALCGNPLSRSAGRARIPRPPDAASPKGDAPHPHAAAQHPPPARPALKTRSNDPRLQCPGPAPVATPRLDTLTPPSNSIAILGHRKLPFGSKSQRAEPQPVGNSGNQWDRGGAGSL